jgi:hypothetical protein
MLMANLAADATGLDEADLQPVIPLSEANEHCSGSLNHHFASRLF